MNKKSINLYSQVGQVQTLIEAVCLFEQCVFLRHSV